MMARHWELSAKKKGMSLAYANIIGGGNAARSRSSNPRSAACAECAVGRVGRRA